MNIRSLTPGTAIRIVKTFKDCGGAQFEAGSVLHFRDRHYLPYHDGHTVIFEETTMSLCDTDDTRVIVDNVGHEYFEPLEGVAG